LPLEGAVGQATALAQEGDHLLQDCHKVHPVFSLSGGSASMLMARSS
jgi:hypothetical protein